MQSIAINPYSMLRSSLNRRDLSLLVVDGSLEVLRLGDLGSERPKDDLDVARVSCARMLARSTAERRRRKERTLVRVDTSVGAVSPSAGLGCLVDVDRGDYEGREESQRLVEAEGEEVNALSSSLMSSPLTSALD